MTEQATQTVARLDEAAEGAPPARFEDADDGNNLIRFALENGADVEVLERLVALQDRVADRNAEMAMAQALASFQEDCPPISRTKTADVKKDGRKIYDYKFSPYDEIVRTIRPHLAAHGLSYTHDSRIVDNEVEVTCTLRHVDGATRTATFRGPVDNSGGKNPLQGVGSSRSYGKRYTLTDVAGLATEDDDDGAGAGGSSGPPITDNQAADLQAKIEEVGANKGAFLNWLGIGSLSALPASRMDEALRGLDTYRKQSEERAAKAEEGA